MVLFFQAAVYGKCISLSASKNPQLNECGKEFEALKECINVTVSAYRL